MVRKPINFDTWIEYHLSIGIDYIFLEVEDTPELKIITDKYSNVIANFINDSDKKDNYWTLIDRQRLFFEKVKRLSLSLNLQWLIHSDADELLCCSKPLKQILSEVQSKYDTVHFDNYEAVYLNDSCENVFYQTNTFRYKNKLSYANGKSAVRLSENSQWSGPHKFGGNRLDIKPRIAVILHFESPTFDSWYEKFSTSSDTEGDKLEKIPFHFYRDSIRIIKSESKEVAREYYNKMKVNVDDDLIKLYWTPSLSEKNINWS
jgi:hypothetical protein